jgi:hypothetical protein
MVKAKSANKKQLVHVTADATATSYGKQVQYYSWSPAHLRATSSKLLVMSATPATYDRAAELRALDATLAGGRGLVASGAMHVPRIFRVPGPQEKLRASADADDVPAGHTQTVPVISLDGPDHAAVVDSVRQAAAEWGFFQVTGHGVPDGVRAAAIAAVRAFHDADGGEGSNKARLYSREPGKAAKYHCNFDLFQSSVANWRDTLYLCMAPDPPADQDLPESCR